MYCYVQIISKPKWPTRAPPAEVTDRLENSPAVAILGPDKLGRQLSPYNCDQRPSLHLDLQLDTDRAKLDDPAPYLLEHSDKLIVLDEIHRVPELFGALRAVIDTHRRNGRRQAHITGTGT